VGAGTPCGDAGSAAGLSGVEGPGAESPRAVLDRWEEHGAVWRVATLTPERAQVDLCACTGEPVDRLESADPELIAYLRERPSSED
jgi:hypothetical protein